MPGSTLSTWLAVISVDSADKLATALRAAEQPVVGRITDDNLVLDPRTVLEEQDETMLASIIEAASALAADGGTGVRND